LERRRGRVGIVRNNLAALRANYRESAVIKKGWRLRGFEAHEYFLSSASEL